MLDSWPYWEISPATVVLENENGLRRQIQSLFGAGDSLEDWHRQRGNPSERFWPSWAKTKTN